MVNHAIFKHAIARLFLLSNIFTAPIFAKNVLDNINDYGDACKCALGSAMPDFDCAQDATEIPVTNNGTSEITNLYVCDKPSLVQRPPCVRESRIGRKTIGDVDWVFICRGNYGKNEFNEIAVIAHNRANGAACFFRSAGEVASGKVVPVASSEKTIREAAEKYWHKPSNLPSIAAGKCANCHESGPWIRDPFVRQKPLEKIVPEQDLATPYWLVADLFPAPTSIGIETTCTECHRIGANEPNLKYYLFSAGGYDPETSTISDFPMKFWMPKDHGLGFGEWKQQIIPKLKPLKDCSDVYLKSIEENPTGDSISQLNEKLNCKFKKLNDVPQKLRCCW